MVLGTEQARNSMIRLNTFYIHLVFVAGVVGC